MNTLDTLKKQWEIAHDWTYRTLKGIPYDKWMLNPPGLSGNLNWIVGHMLITQYFHAGACIHPKEKRPETALKLGHYSKFYGMGSQPDDFMDDKPGPELLLADLRQVDRWVLDSFADLTEADLEKPVLVPSPVAKTQLEAHIFGSHHHMYHVGQIPVYKRAFGL